MERSTVFGSLPEQLSDNLPHHHPLADSRKSEGYEYDVSTEAEDCEQRTRDNWVYVRFELGYRDMYDYTGDCQGR